jgi:hypothetical protein
MAPKMGQIYEDGGEDYDGTIKVNKGDSNNAFRLPSDMRNFDSMLDTSSLILN